MARVVIKFTGDLYAAVGTFGTVEELPESDLRHVVDYVLDRYKIRDVMVGADGRLLPRARILVNGRYIELLQGWETQIRDGDTVSLMMPGTFVT